MLVLSRGVCIMPRKGGRLGRGVRGAVVLREVYFLLDLCALEPLVDIHSGWTSAAGCRLSSSGIPIP